MSEHNPKHFGYPTQPLDLPSKGLVYPVDHPLAAGKIELKIPSAQEEDILTNSSYMQKGMLYLLNKLLESVIVSPKFNIDDLIYGDKDAILLATRILAYGADYSFKYDEEEVTVNLSQLQEKPLNEDLFKPGVNEFEFALPHSKRIITFKFLTGKEEKAIEAENKGIQKINKSWSGEVTTPLKHMILSVDGSRDTKTIREFVNVMPIRDSKAFRAYVSSIAPEIVRKFTFERQNGEVVEDLHIPMTVEFFWPK